MYSKAKGIKERDSVTPPPGYDGNRFCHNKELDDPFFGEKPPSPTKNTFPAKAETAGGEVPEADIPRTISPPAAVASHTAHIQNGSESKHFSGLTSFFGNIGKEELLLISLLLILAEEKKSDANDAILLLVILLCC